ncbi:MAG: efflux RND transporter periplasmic adaptor subunit [Gammaproteobacteria bacterium]|nr:efflux RND transporter periplasmic adaptor subunit [Gammaproteobacteria bacterium]
MGWKIISLCLVPLVLAPFLAQSEAEESRVAAQAAFQRETLSGFTRERTRLKLSAEADGRVVEVTADVGDVIATEEPFACLDPTFVELERRANLAEIASLQIDVRHFRKQVKRFSQLLKQNSSSQSQLDDAQHSLDQALSQLALRKIQTETLAERIRRLCVTAPRGWIVIRRYVEVGQWINTGSPVVEVGDFSRLMVPFALSMEEFQALQERADALTLYLPELNHQTAARLERVSPGFDEASRKVYVELEIPGTDIPSRGGLRAELKLDIPMRSGAVLLPAKALVERYEEHWLKRPDGEEINVVYLGRAREGDWVRVISPQVKPGDQFLLPEE